MNSLSSSTRSRARLQKRKRESVRRVLLETLEQRQLLTTGPMLTGVQPNEGDLLFDVRSLDGIDSSGPVVPVIEGATLTTAPREFTFRFDDSSAIDASTLDGIRITRAGADGTFEAATATTDLGTDGAAIVEFRSKISGTAGNGQLVRFTSVDRSGTSLPVVRVTDGVVEIELNSNPARVTRIQDLLVAVSASTEANELVDVVLVSGPSLTAIGQTGGGRTLTLQGANSAQGLTDFGLNSGTFVRFIADTPGPEGRGISIDVTPRMFGGPASPVVTVQGQAIGVQVNTTPGFESTISELLSAINGNPESAALVTGVVEIGDGTTSLGNIPANLPTLVLTGAGDEVLTPGYVGLGDSAREIVFRFNENLPDDTYRIDILGAGSDALLNVNGEAFNGGEDLAIEFDLNLGPQVVAVVPEPIRRAANGTLSPETGKIEVFFNANDWGTYVNNQGLNRPLPEKESFYQLVFKGSDGSDVVVTPIDVTYNGTTRVATLQFANSLSRLLDPTSGSGEFLQGAFRMRVGTEEGLPGPAVYLGNVGDAADSFDAAHDLTADLGSVTTTTSSLIIDGAIQNTDLFPFALPGGQDTAGRRELRPDDPSRLMGPIPLDYFRIDENGDLVGDADNELGITQLFYNFEQSYLGPDPVTGEDRTYFNVITEEQKQRVREVMTLFSEYLGIQFVESESLGTTIVAGDLYSANGDAVSGQGGLVVAVRPDGADADRFPELGVLDFQDFDESNDDRFGGEFSRGAMLLVGQLIGYGFADDLPQPVTQSTDFVLNPGADTEATYPSVADILHGQYLYRPESADIDLYQFTLDAPGKLTAETFAERSEGVSLLDTALRLYRQSDGGSWEEIAQNDDYSSNDSLIDLELPAGVYALGVSASGNTEYDPTVPGTGFGGRSEGDYQLRLTVRPSQPQGLVDSTGLALDGDADGKPGGVFNFWYAPAEPLNPQLRALQQSTPGVEVTPATIYVDKQATGTGNGSFASPFREIDLALAAALPGDTVRVIANGGADGKVSTAEDNLSYQIGIDSLGRTLADGASLEVPQGVNLVVDAGAVIKFRNSRVAVGSDSPMVDRSGSSLQVLGTPILVESNGLVAVNDRGEPIPGSVIFTSYNDKTAGGGNGSTLQSARAGDWGGIDFRGAMDVADETRVNLEAQGVFMNQIYGADIRYAGGQVSVGGYSQAIAPISFDITRPTLAYSKISNSASAAIEGTPDSFVESSFMDYVAPGTAGEVSDYERIGPDIHNNTLVDNSINGLFVRIRQRTGETLQPLTTQARFDDIDVVHVLAENLVIEGTAGGPVVETTIPSSVLIRGSEQGGGVLSAGTYVYRLAFVDANGNATPASDPTQEIELTATGAIQLSQLPAVPENSPFISRRLYRAPVDSAGVVGDFRMVGVLNGSASTFVDNGGMTGPILVDRALQLRSRPDASLTMDPGLVVKLDGARIETSFGGNLRAEGRDGLPVVMTSLNDSRFGEAGSFKTSGSSLLDDFTPGDWAGVYVGYAGAASLDHVRIAGAGGVSRIPGGFASFNPLEVHQGELRVTNSRFESNAGGIGTPGGTREGLGSNSEGTIFVRGAAPTIVNNTLIDGEGAAITIDVNSMSYQRTSDSGRSTGELDRFDIRGNSGPLIQGNDLDNNDINGLLVRGGELATEVVFDDVDIVHVVTDTISIPNQHVFGGLRLESAPDASLVVKFQSSGTEEAGIAVGGSFVSADDELADIADRIGGSMQLVGFPEFPVILTTLSDDSVGAGFTPAGDPQVDTNNDGLFGGSEPTTDGFAQLPYGPEVNNGTRIDNDVNLALPGFFEAVPGPGGSIGVFNFTTGSRVTTAGLGGLRIGEDYIFEYLNMIDVGADGGGFSLDQTTITQQPTLIADDRVQTRGTFAGENGTVNWTVETYFRDGVPVLFNQLTLESTASLGNMRMISYLDEDIDFVSDDILYTTGTPGEADFRAFTIDGPERIGFSQGGYYTEDGQFLSNAQYVGWTADIYRDLLDAIEGGGTAYTVPGNIDVADLPPFTDSRLGDAFGPGDVTTAFAWDVDPNAFSATITSFLELVPRDPSSARPEVESGLWKGVTIREGASDRNVAAAPENESTSQDSPGVNGVPGASQFLGELAADSRGGDENQRLGFVVDGELATRDDLDVYSFIGRAGSQVWLDIDRTEMTLDTVVELIDVNGNVLASSDNSAAESLDPSLLYVADNMDPESVSPMNAAPLAGQDLAAAQDQYSSNPKDAGMRIVLPGESGSRSVYHVRVRSANDAGGDITPVGADADRVREGLTKGGYRLQVRLREADEFPGTQVRFSDVRYAQTNLEIIGQPQHSPLLGEASETTGDNDSRASAQPIGPYSVADNANNPAAANILESDRLSLTVGGEIDSATDVDWYQFDVNYDGLASQAAARYLSTVLDIDFADGFARTDISLYVFNSDGELVLQGLDSNIAEDQPRFGQGADVADLSRGSAGTDDPFIGSVELPEGRYFVAVSNHTQVPSVLNQLYQDPTAGGVVDDPFLRLEPISGFGLVAEDRFGGQSSASNAPLLFSGGSVIPLTLNDLVMYTMTSEGTIDAPNAWGLTMSNAFNGGSYGQVGTSDPLMLDFAARPTGEFFSYLSSQDDDGVAYYQISSEDGSLTLRGGVGLEDLSDDDDLDVGLTVNAITFANSDIGYMVANRWAGIANGADYTSNIVWQFDAATGDLLSGPLGDQDADNGTGAFYNVRDRGFIDTNFSPGASNTINVSAATRVGVNGSATTLLSDGTGFAFRDSVGTLYRFEFNSGPDFRMRYDSDAGVFVRDGDTLTLSGVTYEFNTGGAIEVDIADNISAGASVALTDAAGTTLTFEFTKDGNVAPGSLPVSIADGMTAGEVAAALADAVNGAAFDITADALGDTGEVGLSGDSDVTAPVVSGTGVSFVGGFGLNDAAAVEVALEEGVSFEMFVDGIRGALQTPVTIGVAGDRVNFRGAVSGNDFTDLLNRDIIIPNAGSPDGSYGNGQVTPGSTGIGFLASDSQEVIAQRVAAAINSASIGTITATANGRSVTISDAILSANEVNEPGSPIRLTGVAQGGTVTGVEFMNGRLYAVSSGGGLYVVDNPSATVQGRIGRYVSTATDLINFNFSGLTRGPNIQYIDTWSNPGSSSVRSMSALLFGVESNGRVHAFNTAGVLQPVFAGGETSMVTAGSGVRAVEMSTLDYNLWNITDNRGADPGHGTPEDPFGTRPATEGGNSLYFGYAQGDEGGYTPASASGNNYNVANSPVFRPRLDGQAVNRTYNFPGGAVGAIESDTFSLAGYAADDLPNLYFNYFLGTDAVDGTSGDQDALNVYVIREDGEAVLVATNNNATDVGTNDDALDPVAGAQVMPLFDNADWRQARVPLAAFAGESGLRLRVEFSTGGQMSNNSLRIRATSGAGLSDGETLTVSGQTLELDFGPILSMPTGLALADFYDAADGGTPGSAATTRVEVDVDGTVFILSDGLRTINAGEVEVLLDDLATLTPLEVADALATAIAANRPAPMDVTGFNFSAEPNNEIASATVLPRSMGDTVISGDGRLGTAIGTELNDVDLSRIDLSAGETLDVTVTQTSGGFSPTIRLFDASGRELTNATGASEAVLSYTSTTARTVYIGVNSGGSYNPNILGSAATGFGGTYDMTVATTGQFDVVQSGRRVQIVGAVEATTNEPTLVGAAGELGVTGDNIRVPLRIDMTAEEVAIVLSDVLAADVAGGNANVYSRFGDLIDLSNASGVDAGPFGLLGQLPGDRFGELGPGRAVNNVHEGVYLDDFVIGFAERGEMVTGASANDTFTDNVFSNISNPPVPTDGLVTGSYQLEIRDGSEYINGSTLEQFRFFDTNARLVDGATTIVAPSVNEIADGDTFTINDGINTLTFEFDDVQAANGVTPGHVQVAFDSNTTSVNSDRELATAIIEAINSPAVQSVLQVSALSAAGVDGQSESSSINLSGTAVISDNSGALQVITSAGRGDANRERDDQGVILIESSRFSYASQYGIDINHGATSDNNGQTSSNWVSYPRNLVELNEDGLVPGVVVQSNTVAYSGLGGIRVTGLDVADAAYSPVAFDRIVNNTIVGGSISPGETTPAETYQGLLFDTGSQAFADAVVSYDPLAGGGPAPDVMFQDTTQILGVPDAQGAGPEPTDGLTTLSLGYGGTVTLQFTDNLLTGDGTAAADLVVFEVGEIESVRVEVSRDGVNFTSVGLVGGLSNRIDIDAYGFTPQDRLSYVRLTDVRQGDPTSLSTGADIDAVGALSSVPADVYVAGGTGVEIASAAPTVINNVIANTSVGLNATGNSGLAIGAANTFYRNSTNVTGGATLGLYSQVIADAVNVFVSPTELTFDPAAGSPLIDSSIDSLPDRSSLATVRMSIGLEQSPILAPRLDVNGQLRVDDPNVDAPSGVGENVFKDRGASDRADQVGPVALLVMPFDNDAAGLDVNPARNVVSYVGGPSNAFEIQLVDGLAPNDPVPGVGVADGSVTGESVLVLRDNQPLVEGVDYRFAYQPTSNTIRLTPLSGVWQDDAVYTIRLLDSNDSLIVAADGDTYTDGDMISIVDDQNQLTTLEIETGISVVLPTVQGLPVIVDGETFSVFDGTREVIFETDTDGAVTPGRQAVELRSNMQLGEVTAAYVTAINTAGLNLTATASDGDRIQLTGSNILTTVEPITAPLNVSGEIGVSTGYGLRVPTLDGQPDGVLDGETFAIRRGAFQVVRFEINTGGGLQNPGHVAVNVPAGAGLDGIADALVAAIGGAGLGLVPTNEGFGRVALNGDASYSLELTDTTLQVVGVPGQAGSVAVPISIAPENTAGRVSETLATIIETSTGGAVTTSVVGPRVILNGVIGVAGTGSLSLVTIRDRVGNLLQSNQTDGTTEFTIFLGAGYDYGDAPEPHYETSQAVGGPRHAISEGLTLGATVTPDGDAQPNDTDLDDGVIVSSSIYSGFDATFMVDVQTASGDAVLDYWVDWNGDGEFSATEKGARLAVGAGLSVGMNTISVSVPSLGTAADGRPLYSVVGDTFARFRLTSAGIDSPMGDAPDGEVEDHRLSIMANPFQNSAQRWDVNASGDVSPIDILQVVNALNRSGSTAIQLDPLNPPVGPPYLDVNGDGQVTPIDALAVLNYIENSLLGGSGEGEGGAARSYVMAGNGVLATLGTSLGDASLASGTAWSTGNLRAEGEAEIQQPPAELEMARKSTTSVFDPAAEMSVDDVIETLARDHRNAEGDLDESGHDEEALTALDAFFGGLGD